METSFFKFVSKGNGRLNLNILAWNINGVKNKLEKLQSFLKPYDIICLSEIKTPIKISLAGYKCYMTSGNNTHRGGCAMLIKENLVCEICGISAASDYIALRLKSLPNLLIICCYIAPSDSPYASTDCLSRISGELNDNPDSSIVLIGDMNCHFGNIRNSFLPAECNPNLWTYENVRDVNVLPNQNAKLVATALPNMLPINGLRTESRLYPSKYTYRQGQRWIS